MSPKDVAGTLSEALKDNDCARVEELIADGAGVSRIDTKRMRPLRYAAESGCMQCVTLLLSRGADVQATVSMNAPSALSIAASNGHVDVLECLLNNCVDESIINGEKEQQSPLHYACSNGQIDVLCYILEKYPHVVHLRASADANRRTLLHAAAGNGSIECIEVLLEHGTKVTTLDIDDNTVLRGASWKACRSAISTQSWRQCSCD